MANSSESGRENEISLDSLPSALLATMMTKLDVPSIRSIACTCKTFYSCASHILSFLPSFHLLDIAPSADMLRPLLPPNPYLRSLKLDCTRLDDSSLDFILRPTLQELCLHNCSDFSGKLLSQVGRGCTDLRFLYLSSVADKRGRSIDVSDLEELLSGCTQLETMILMFDVSIFLRHNFARVWALAPVTLSSLEIGYISSVMVTELLSPPVVPQQSLNYIQPSVLPGIQKLCLSVDYITDTMISTISRSLCLLTYLDLRDSPIMEPRMAFDLTNAGLQQINPHGKLKHLSLIRSQEIFPAYFKRVNDLGILLMADRCSSMESICLGGFCQVTDTGFKTVLHSCANLFKLRVSHGPLLTDLVFHDIAATSLTLTHASLRWCNLLTNYAVARLASNRNLSMLDLRDCRNLGDEALRAISSLPKLKVLLIDGSDISDAGFSYFSKGVMNSLVSLSVRGCKRLTDKCISFLFEGSSKQELRELDLSNIPNFSDAGILSLVKSRIPIFELRVRQCPLIGDTSVMVLASMKFEEVGWQGSSLRLLDLYNCGGITQLSFQWLKKPYFPRLRWLGVSGNANRDMVDNVARNRPYVHVTCRGEELGIDQWDTSDDLYMHDYDEVDELEQWLLEGDNESDEEMEEGANAGDNLE
ncbi:F-box/LRR-repeat protein 10 [Ipomoea triloba]|uniref:F-box/LRR-repeat protein 10 n=1 Tax=Ipomoea triloba TaxID=35885 RepID=UPI00125DDDC9|nr:F-box/LRR-repeat protein 10 [Ipomoea triloba]